MTSASSDPKHDRKLDAMLLSVMKSGSTWLAEQCRKHPHIFLIPGQKIETTPEKGVGHIDWTGYNNEPVVVGRRNLKLEPYFREAYYQHNPRMKFIVFLRDPVSRSFSQYSHEVRKNYFKFGKPDPAHKETLFKKTYDFNRAVEEIDENNLPGFIQFSRYFDRLKPYFDSFGQENFLIYSLEAGTKDAKKLFDEVSDFLGVPRHAPDGHSEVVNAKSFDRLRYKLFKKQIEIIGPTPETKQRIKELVWPNIEELDKRLPRNLTQDWS